MQRSGYIAIAGRPNAGKSTLLNRIAGSKVSIVSHRRQTTRSIVRALSDTPDSCIAWLDTPGWQNQHGGNMNRALNAAAEWALHSADAIVFTTAAGAWTKADTALLDKLPPSTPTLCALNKIDLIGDKNTLLPMMQALADTQRFCEIVPVSALRGGGVHALLNECTKHLPPRAQAVQAQRDLPFFFAELLREKLFRALGDELPYCIGVVAQVEEAPRQLLHVAAEIFVERDSQKPIVIGKGGVTLKRIGRAARQEMERYSGRKVHLNSYVRVADWQRDATLLRRMKIGTFPDAPSGAASPAAATAAEGD